MSARLHMWPPHIQQQQVVGAPDACLARIHPCMRPCVFCTCDPRVLCTSWSVQATEHGARVTSGLPTHRAYHCHVHAACACHTHCVAARVWVWQLFTTERRLGLHCTALCPAKPPAACRQPTHACSLAKGGGWERAEGAPFLEGWRMGRASLRGCTAGAVCVFKACLRASH